MEGFSGKVGSVVYAASARGWNTCTVYPDFESREKVSEAEQANWKKLAEAQYWLKSLIDFVKVGFKNYHLTYPESVAAKSYLIRNAIKGNYPNMFMDPSLMLVSYQSSDSPKLSVYKDYVQQMYRGLTHANQNS